MHVLVFAGFYLPGFKGGGPIRTIANMIDQVGDEIQFSLYTNDRDLGESTAYASIMPDDWQRVGKTNVFYASPAFGWIFKLWKNIANFDGDALHLNSFFSFRFSFLPLIFWSILKFKKPIILGARGEFSKGALMLKAPKKFFFIRLFRMLGLHKNITWHASTDHEALDIRRVMGERANIRLAIDIARPGDDVNFSPRVVNGPLRIVFISRISPMKNLLGAIKMLCRVKAHVIFDVYGPTEDEFYWKECRSAAELLPDNVNFNYCGTLLPNKVLGQLTQYDLFFFPTLGENFGHVIAEALSAGLPLLISDATPWRDLSKKLIGWDIPLHQPEIFVACIEECCSKPPEEYDNWRKSIRAWAVNNIGNKDAIEQNRQLFMNLK